MLIERWRWNRTDIRSHTSGVLINLWPERGAIRLLSSRGSQRNNINAKRKKDNYSNTNDSDINDIKLYRWGDWAQNLGHSRVINLSFWKSTRVPSAFSSPWHTTPLISGFLHRELCTCKLPLSILSFASACKKRERERKKRNREGRDRKNLEIRIR